MCCEAPLRLCVIYCKRMDVQKLPKGPFTFFGTMRFTGDHKKFRKKVPDFFPIFSSCGYCRREYLTFEVLLLFLSLRYGADLGRSRIVGFLKGFRLRKMGFWLFPKVVFESHAYLSGNFWRSKIDEILPVLSLYIFQKTLLFWTLFWIFFEPWTHGLF